MSSNCPIRSSTGAVDVRWITRNGRDFNASPIWSAIRLSRRPRGARRWLAILTKPLQPNVRVTSPRGLISRCSGQSTTGGTGTPSKHSADPAFSGSQRINRGRGPLGLSTTALSVRSFPENRLRMTASNGCPFRVSKYWRSDWAVPYPMMPLLIARIGGRRSQCDPQEACSRSLKRSSAVTSSPQVNESPRKRTRSF
jgi:hypothetical protein